MNYSPLILIIDDEVAILQTLKESLQDEGFRAQTLSDGNKALSLIGELVPDLVFLDVFMPNCNGIELLGKIKKEYPAQKVIIISGFGNIPLAIDAVKHGAIDFIEKPFNLDDIFSKILFLKDTQKDSQINFKSNSADLACITDTKENSPAFDLPSFELIGESFLFQELITQVKNVANLKYPLLIYGEHGTGKTKLAEFVHYFCHPELACLADVSVEAQRVRHSLDEDGRAKSEATAGRRRDSGSNHLKNKSFTVIDCLSQVDTDSINFDLTGTVLIKNIEALSSDSQKRLLAYMQSDQYKNKNNDGVVKIIATSCKSLFDLTCADKFNKLLFYKLNITPVEVPSINKRRYDIPLLLDYWLKKFNEINNKNIQLDAKCIRYLRNRYWPGNIAQIKTLIEKLVLAARDKNSNISMNMLEKLLSEREVEFVEEQSFLSFNSLEDAKQNFERKYLLYILRKSNFDLQQTSEKLNISISVLSDKVSKLNINLKSLNSN